MPDQSNGHAKSNGEPDKQAKEVFRVQVRRVLLNETIHVRTLSEQLRGLFVHWYAKHSHYCPGKDCPPHIHKMKPTWKGYIAAEEWIQHRKKWRPCVLEVTEHCELDMRFLYQRGQVWELWRPSDPGKANPPTFAVLREELNPANLNKAWDFTPVLKHLYHVFSIDCSLASPLPPKIIAEEIDGDAPEHLSSGAASTPANVPDGFSFAGEFDRRLNERKKALLNGRKGK
jgi:hypothetical protein